MQNLTVASLCLGLLVPQLAHAATLFDGLYTPAVPERYYDAWIETTTNEKGDVVGLTEWFSVEGVPSKPFRFICEGTTCVNIEKPNWHITIVSELEYVDDYNGFVTNYNFIEPPTPEEDSSN